MAKIKLSEGGYTPIPEGKHIFKIVKSTYDEDFGKLELEMVTKSGQKHTERFFLVGNDGEVNEPANRAFSYLAKTALNNFNLDEIDTDDLVGCYIEAVVEHDVQPHRNDPAKKVTFIKLGEKSPASGFEDDEDDDGADAPTPPKKSGNKKTGGIDLDALLG